MKYVLDKDNTVLGIHDDSQDLSGLYPGLRVLMLKESYGLGEPLVPPADYGAAFEASCAVFRKVCAEIGKLSGEADFRGGFDEFNEFQQGDAAKTPEGMSLSLGWSAANDCCIYEAKKLGLGQPEWWHKCWSENRK